MSIEERYLTRLANFYAPDVEQPEPSVDGMQLAAGPSETVSDAGAGRGSYAGYSPRDAQNNVNITGEIKPYDPTVRERMSEFLQAGFEKLGIDRYKARQNAQTLLGGPSSNLPLQAGLADIVPFLGTALQTEEAVRLGEESVNSAKQGNYGTAAAQAGIATLGMIPGAVGTVKAGKALAPKAGEMVIDSMNKLGTPVQMNMMPDGPAMAAKPAAPVNDLGFYSAVEQAAMNIQRKSGTGQAMLNDITKGQDVKLDEVKWIGLDDFLKGKKNVTREEVQQYIAANKVDIQEVTLGGAEPFDAQRLSQLESEYRALKDHPIDDPSFGEEKYDEMIRLLNIRDQSTTQSLYDAADRAMSSAQRAQRQGNRITAEKYFREAELLNTRAEKLDLQGEGLSNPPKFDKYQLPGGENYREILLTMPQTGVKGAEVKSVGDGWFAAFKDGKQVEDTLSRTQQGALDAAGFWKKDQDFTSIHWDEKNVLAHIRVNDRVDADGKKMLLVEEVQSDWHQAGRDKGYKTDIAQRLKDIDKQIEKAKETDPENVFWLQRERDQLASGNDYRVPDAPMKDTWYQLALKRVLKYAADNGYERVGLTTGSRQAERFDLSKQVDEIRYTKNEDGTFKIAAVKDNNAALKEDSVTEQRLADLVGKDIAKKIVNGEGKVKEQNGNVAAHTSLTGLDLQVGGEGMKKYYDEIYPTYLQKYGKKWGAKVGETYLPIYDKATSKSGAEPVRFVDITPEMRQSVGKGQPLFSATAAGAGTGAATMQDKEKN